MQFQVLSKGMSAVLSSSLKSNDFHFPNVFIFFELNPNVFLKLQLFINVPYQRSKHRLLNNLHYVNPNDVKCNNNDYEGRSKSQTGQMNET